jgi:hypothetical protein
VIPFELVLGSTLVLMLTIGNLWLGMAIGSKKVGQPRVSSTPIAETTSLGTKKPADRKSKGFFFADQRPNEHKLYTNRFD